MHLRRHERQNPRSENPVHVFVGGVDDPIAPNAAATHGRSRCTDERRNFFACAMASSP